MTVNHEERQFMRNLPPKRLGMCPKLQAAKDKKLKSALAIELGTVALAETAMRVVRECRG